MNLTFSPQKENEETKITQLKSQLGEGGTLTSCKLPSIREGVTKIKCKRLGQCPR